MENLPGKPRAQARLFKVDNDWLVKKAHARHTIVAVIIHDLIERTKVIEESLEESEYGD